MPETGRRVTLATLSALGVLWAGYLALQLSAVHFDGLSHIDVLVYRAGGHAIIDGNSIYAQDFADVNSSPVGLPFTYPPFSALLFAPLAIVPAGVAKIIMVALNVVASAVLLGLVVVAVQNRWDRLRNWPSLTAPISVRTGIVMFVSAVVFLLSVPVLSNFSFGQVNIVLAALVALDLLLPSVRWPRGLLVGFAVAIKLTPAVFMGYFFVTRQWRALAVSMATTAAVVGISWLIIPSDTVRYFTSTLFDATRIGGLAYSSNQSMRGVMERIPAMDAVHGVVWVVATALVLLLGIVAIKVNCQAGDTVAAVLSAGYIGLLCSPVSWGHHWVWLSVTAVYFLVRWAATGGTRNLVAGITVAVVALAAPWVWLPNTEGRERLWNPVEHVLGDLWTITALALLVWFATAASRAGIPADDAEAERKGAQCESP